MDNLPPFWALLKCGSPNACHNMEIETIVFTDGGCQAADSKYPKISKLIGFAVDIAIARNTSCIEQGEILCLPYSDE